MIIQELADRFIMIAQHDHAAVSGEMIANWKSSLFNGDHFRKSVEYAIYNHDYGWKLIDKQPFWNEQKQIPYTFIEFPTLPKIVFYKYGIDEVAQEDSYAGLLCSRHYTRFMLNHQAHEVETFVKREKKRQQQIIQTIPDFDYELYDFHYGLLQLCDDLSLYICLKEPGIAKENEHHFFKDGVSISPAMANFQQDKIQLYWRDTSTIIMSEFPFNEPLNIRLQQKTVMKESILNNGLINSYQKAPVETVDVLLLSEGN